MAVIPFPHHAARAPVGSLNHTPPAAVVPDSVSSRLPLAVLALVVSVPVVDLLARLQAAAVLSQAATLLSAAVALLLILEGALARRPSSPWVLAAALAFAASLPARLLGAELAALPPILGILALGVAGAFASEAAFGADDTSSALPAPRSLPLDRPVAEPVPLRRAA